MAPGSLRPELGKERSFELDETLKFLKIKKKKRFCYCMARLFILLIVSF